MSRSGYSDGWNDWASICWRGAVKSAIRGKRGQVLLKEMLVALDAMEVKELIAEELELNGQHCALGVLGEARGIQDMSAINTEEPEEVAEVFNIAPALVMEITFMNDEAHMWHGDTPVLRWRRVRQWVAEQITPSQPIKATP